MSAPSEKLAEKMQVADRCESAHVGGLVLELLRKHAPPGVDGFAVDGKEPEPEGGGARGGGGS